MNPQFSHSFGIEIHMLDARHNFYSTVVPSPYRVPVAALAIVLVFQGFLSGLAALLVCHEFDLVWNSIRCRALL